MKKGLLNDAATYDAYMAWYTSWNRLVEVIGEKDAILFAHKISTTNSCQLCSLFFISDLKALGLDPGNLVLEENEKLLQQLGQQIVKDPTKVSDELLDGLRKFYTDTEIIIIVGFGAQMQATNNFNSVLGVDVDERLLPLKDEFKPVTWRENIK
jgi:alkylhydroperoxidase family enzyme